MGYTTDFEGSLSFNKEISKDLKIFINKFASVRHVRRDIDIIKKINPNWKDFCYNGNLGFEGEYYTGGLGFCGQDIDDSVIDINCPPKSVPGLWCQWVINDANELEWDGGEKFYNYKEWLCYLIEHFFEPEGYVLNGDISFQGEDDDDLGIIRVTNNKVIIIR